MAIDPPYRLDPLQNPVKVKGAPEGESPVPQPGGAACWGHFACLLLATYIGDGVYQLTKGTTGDCFLPPVDYGGPAEAVGQAADCFGLAVDSWYISPSETYAIRLFCYGWISSPDCGFAPGPQSPPPPENPPDDWEGHDQEFNSENQEEWEDTEWWEA